MDLSKVLSLTGKSGLFKLISQTKTSFIVESLIDGKRFPAFSHDGVSILDNIAIFTEDDEVALREVFEIIYKKEAGKKTGDVFHNNETLKSYFAEILPHYDREKVYVSNMKKVITWYNLLVEHNLISIEDKEEEMPATKEGEEQEEK